MGSLLVEEIDTGDAKLRQVVSGLAKYCSPDELTVRIMLELVKHNFSFFMVGFHY